MAPSLRNRVASYPLNSTNRDTIADRLRVVVTALLQTLQEMRTTAGRVGRKGGRKPGCPGWWSYVIRIYIRTVSCNYVLRRTQIGRLNKLTPKCYFVFDNIQAVSRALTSKRRRGVYVLFNFRDCVCFYVVCITILLVLLIIRKDKFRW